MGGIKCHNSVAELAAMEIADLASRVRIPVYFFNKFFSLNMNIGIVVNDCGSLNF